MTKEIISLQSPQSLMGFSGELKKFIVSQNLFTNIKGKNYVNVEGWQFAGGNLGIFPVVETCEKLERGTEVAYRASVALYAGEKIVSRGIAICSSKESGKTGKDEYVIASMAQTRAEGKAYRLILGWLMKVAGYEPTPTEEVSTEEVAKNTLSAEEINLAKSKLDKCINENKLKEVWKSLSKELKANKEIIAYANDIKSLIKENENL